MAGEHSYPAPLWEAALAHFTRWLGSRYARSVSVQNAVVRTDEFAIAELIVGRRWTLSTAILNLAASEANYRSELARAALERRLDEADITRIVWVPRAAPLPYDEPDLSAFVVAVEGATPVGDGRLEARFPVQLALRRIDTSGSVVTIVGGLSESWAQFTNRVPGSYHLDARALHRLSADPQVREEVVERIVLASQQPEVDEGVSITALDCWTVTPSERPRSYVVASPEEPSDELSARQRRTLRRLLADAKDLPGASDARALALLTVSTYAEGERVSWALRGIDPALYAGFDIVIVIADGVAKPALEPPRATLPWDAPPMPQGRGS